MVGRRFISGPAGARRRVRPAERASTRTSLRLSFGFYDRHQTGQLMSRATVDLQSVRFFLGYGLIFFFQHVAHDRRRHRGDASWLEWRLALVALAITPLVVAARLPLQPRLAPGPARRAAEDGRRRDGRRGGDRRRPRRQGVRAGGAAAGAVRAALRGRLRRRASAPTASARSTCRCWRSSRCSRRRPCCSSAGAWSSNGSLTLGDVLRVQPLRGDAVMPLRMLGMWIGQAQRATASGERIFEVLDEPEEIADRAGARVALPPGEGRIRVRARVVRVRRRAAGARRRRPRARARHDGRADRAHRLGQDDARLARPALLRRDRRAASCRRRRRARRDADVAPPRDRDRRAGSRSSSRPRVRENIAFGRPDATDEAGRARRPGSRRRTSSSSGCRTATRP